jgi:filamentous hemagglutinin family protein
MNNKLNTNFSMRKLLLTALVAGPLATLPAPLWALPDTAATNLTTSAGVTTQVVGTTTLNITAPDKAILTWQAFGSGASTIAAGDVINYFLPSSSSSVLNSVSGGAASTIAGSIISNGNVYILNPAGIVFTPTAQVNTGGFYASTVAEPSGFFSINGSLSFTGSSTSNIIVQGTGVTSGVDTATIQATGTGNNIYLAGNAVDIQGGKFYGNLFVRASSTLNPLAGGYNVALGSTGPVSVNLVGVPLTGGGLNITTNGGNVRLSGASATTIAPAVGSTTGAVSINTTSASLNGNITQGAGAFTANTTGTVVTLNAGTGTTAGDITLGTADFLTVGASGKNIALSDTSGGVTLNAINAAGTLSVGSTGSIFQGSGTHSVGGLITLTPAASSTVNFTGTGNLTFASIGTTSTIAITTSGDITFNSTVTATQPLTVVSTGGQITATTLSSGSTLTLTANSSAGKLTASGGIRGNTGTISVAGDISIAGLLQNGGGSTLAVTSSAGNITIGSISASSTLNLTATAGSITTGAIQTSTLNITAANGSVTTGTLSTNNTAVISSGSVTTGAISTSSSLTISATSGTVTTGAITTSSTLTLNATSSAGSITTGVLVSSTTRTVTLNSGGSIQLNTTTAPVLNVISTTGSITQSGAITSTSSATFNAGQDITLTNVANAFTTLVLQGGTAANVFTVVDADSVVIGGGTNAKAATTISTTTNGTITLGNVAIDSISFGSTLNLTTSGTGIITTNANAVTVFGAVNLTTAGTAATLGSNIFGNAANYSFGQINANVGAGALNVYENTTLNLGTITAATLDARSLNSDIVNTGKLTVTGNAIFAANSIFSPGNISLTNTTNALSGNVIIGNAKDFTLVNTVATTVTAGTALVNGKAATGTTSVTVTGGAANSLTLNVGTGGDYNVVSFTAPGAVTVTDTNGLTLQNLSNPFANGAAAVNITSSGPIVLGSGINLQGSGVTTISSTYLAGNLTPGITDSAAGVRIFGETSFISAGNIAITNAGHSFGAVNLTTTGAASAGAGLGAGTMGLQNITYTEGGTANLKNVTVGTATYPGSLTVVSTGGGIQQAAGGTILVPTVTGSGNTVSFTAAAGGVTLANAGNNFAVPVNVSAVGNSSITQSTAQNLVLGNVTVTAGTFAVDTTGTAGVTVTQATGSTVKVYGNTSVNTQGAKITLTNSGNNFGGLTFNSTNGAAAGADVAVTEAGVLNFLAVNTGTAGKLNAMSENASIIQTGTGVLNVGGATTLTASAAGITLANALNVFGGTNGILVTTAGNVSISDSNAITALAGGTTIGGTLVLKNTLGTGEIRDLPGILTVSGAVLFDTTTNVASKINIGSSTASLGAIQFRSGTVTIVENSTLNLAAGSVASGPVTLTSSGNIVTSGSGGGTFQSTLFLNASGNITITNPIFVNGAGGSGLTFRALGAVDLSALSLAGNLNSIAPTALQYSTYKPPSP